MKPVKTHFPQPANGFALVVVLIVIVALGILAGAFALAMKVELRLSSNASNDAEMEWLGRSGVEMARYVLGQSMSQPAACLAQIWAGGPGWGQETNGPLMSISLRDNVLGDGRFSVRIVDQERRLGINLNVPEGMKKAMLERALKFIGLTAGDTPTLVDSIIDWIDPDDAVGLNGTESDFYAALPQPYGAKNGPIDDLAELLLVRGVTPEVYWGPAVTGHRQQTLGVQRDPTAIAEAPTYPVGLVDLFCALSSGRLNINTASIQTLQLLPGVDELVAANIVRARAGLDGVDGTEDDTPFQNLAGLNPGVVPGIIPEMTAQYAAFCGISSSVFEVRVDAQLGRTRRTYTALVKRNSPDNIQVLQFGWQ
jgi:general secretion pathway protein K